jgi:hypothetical protein
MEALFADCTTRLIAGQEHSVLVNVPAILVELILAWLPEHDRAAVR